MDKFIAAIIYILLGGILFVYLLYKFVMKMDEESATLKHDISLYIFEGVSTSAKSICGNIGTMIALITSASTPMIATAKI